MIGRAFLDVRPEPEFLRGHAPGAANVPLEALAARLHELPPREEPLLVFDSDRDRAERAAALLRARDHDVAVAAPGAAPPLAETGPARARLWRPNSFLVEALERVPGRGRALDLACGSGRDATFLALSGFEVEAIDVLPDALERARDLARRSGVAIATLARDIERDPTLPTGRYDLIAVFHFLFRDLFPAIRAALKPGGHLVYETFHERTLETGRRPRDPAHLLKTGEIGRAFGSLEILVLRECVERRGRFVSSLLARRPEGGGPAEPPIERTP